MRWLAAAAVAAAVLAAGACGVETDDEPRAIPRDNVPERLLDQPSAAAGEATADGRVRNVDVFFIRNLPEGGVALEAQEREVPNPPSETSVLEALLLEPPDAEEREGGIVTAIPSSTMLASAPPRRQDNGLLVIDLTEGLFQVQSDTLRNAYAQIVCTATTSIEGVTSVMFESEGIPTPAFDGDGRSVSGPLDCGDYDNLRTQQEDDQ